MFKEHLSMIVSLIITTLIVALGLLIISKLPIGVEVDSIGIAVISAIVFGLLNGLLGWLVAFMRWTIVLWPLALVMNIVIFGLAAWLVQGFRLRNGLISAALGAFALAIVTQLTQYVLNNVLQIAL
jgi:putative membrane protein